MQDFVTNFGLMLVLSLELCEAIVGYYSVEQDKPCLERLYGYPLGTQIRNLWRSMWRDQLGVLAKGDFFPSWTVPLLYTPVTGFIV